ncbi:hypothetical protein HU200_022374 [Digitaria exilis]|uniref:F-box associated beta-propeller type 3 domain-containing protein n=1 Tax=Digitaria exilis TaxID=1010633 RepID=A0A835C7I0_9POAL|nr:hypothetical protein HU200_022374 [Digitaria exilis]
MAPGLASPSSGSPIPDDVLFFQILVLLPVKCLLRFQTVCKLWRATLMSTHFAHRHLEHSRTRPSMVIMPRRYLRYHKMFSLCSVNFYGFQPGQSKVAELILHKRCPGGIPMFSMPLHCDGLIMIPCTTGRIFLCNPATREFVELPQGSHNIAKGQRVAFGFDPWSGKYKVARHFLRSGNGEKCISGNSAGHEILTLGDGEEVWRWKSTMDPPYPINARTPICMRGSFYWSAVNSVTGDGHDKVSLHVILRFSLRDETFAVYPNPPCRGFLSENDMLCELSGKLCYIHSASPLDVAIWLAEDGPNLAWSVRCRLILPIPRQLHVFACASGNGDEIFLSIDAWYLLKCDLRDGSLEEIIDMAHDMSYDHLNGIKFCSGERSVAHYMLPCVESLLRIIPL